EEPSEEPTAEPTEDPSDDPDCSAVEGKMNVDSGELHWGIRESFRHYIANGFAHGEWEFAGGAKEGDGYFIFPVKNGEVNQNGEGFVQFAGSARATGHQGMLNTYFGDPKIVFDGSPTAKLYMYVTSNGTTGSNTDYGVVHFADITLDQHEMAGGNYIMGGEKVVLTEEGSKAFADFYDPGEPLDPAVMSLGISQATTCDPETPSEDPVTPPKPPAPAPGHDHPSKPPVADKPVNPPAPPAAEECTPDPNKLRVTGGTLSWGLRKSFTTYVRGSIAQGGWETTAGASWNGSTFVYPAVSGNFDNASKKGTINYAGTVHFTGHHGVLNTVMSNPSLVINGSSAQLYLTVTSQDMQGNRTNFGRVHFANVVLSNASVSGGILSLQSSSVTLTAAGAKAFAGFYSPGESLDQMSSTVKMAPGSVCDPTTGELKVYGPDGKLVKTGAEVGQFGLATVLFLLTGLAMTAASRRRRA
ncbi:MAG: HtaA domain-containing protein, partial [Flaviflexus sp.]|nr:HtaA domain-containing protein [Flaviflexus sp.]